MIDARFEALRSREFARLDARGHAYLDFTGAGLYARSQIEAHHRRLLDDVLGNPHSENPASRASTERMLAARARLLAFLHADPDDWTVVFTANATAALRLVGEGFPFSPRSHFVLTADNHNSVHGIRCFARRAGADVRYVRLGGDLRSEPPDALLDGTGLFAFPVQSNFSGVRHPLDWIERARDRGWSVLIDAAAFVPTSPLRLDRVRPDFVCLSCYKMFGFPTGIGALVARREALAALARPWFSGGTVDWVSTHHGTHALRPDSGSFEDGTAHFLAFDAVCDGLDLLDGVGMSEIAERTGRLTRRLLAGLRSLAHADGSPLVQVYGPADDEARGGTVAFNVLDGAGNAVAYDVVVRRAGEAGVSVRGGCFCNPGAAEAAFRFPRDRTRECLESLGRDFTVPAFAACLGGPAGAVRASLGLPTTAGDLERLLAVLATFAAPEPCVPRLSRHRRDP